MTDKTVEIISELKCHWELIKRSLPPGSPLFEEGDIYCRLLQKCLPLDDTSDVPAPGTREFACGISNCSQVFDSLIKYEAHYNSSHRHVCQTCHKIYPSSHLLEVHVLETHDVMFNLLSQKQSMFQCLLADCPIKFKTWKDRKNHMIKVHKYPPNYRYDKSTSTGSRKPGVKNGSNKPAVKNVAKVQEKMEAEITGSPSQGGISEAYRDTGVLGAEEMEADSSVATRDGSGTQPHADASAPDIDTQHQSRHIAFSYRVPKDISFGQGVPRGFLSNRGCGRGRKQKKKYWHSSSGGDSTVDIETVSMKDLSDALS